MAALSGPAEATGDNGCAARWLRRHPSCRRRSLPRRARGLRRRAVNRVVRCIEIPPLVVVTSRDLGSPAPRRGGFGTRFTRDRGCLRALPGAPCAPSLAAVVRREDAVGGGRSRAARRPARRRRTSSRIARDAGRAPQPLVELVAHQRPGEVELLAGALVRPARRRRGARGGPSTRSHTSSTPDAGQGRAGEHRRRPLPPCRGTSRSAPASSRAAARASCLAVAVGLVDRDRRRRARGCPS